MSASIVHIQHPFAPQLGARRFQCPAGLTAAEALLQSGWAFDAPTVLLRRDPVTAPTKPSDILLRRREWDSELLEDGDEAVFVTMPRIQGPAPSLIALALAKLASAGAAALVAAFPATLGGSLTVLGATVSIKAVATAVFFIGGQMMVSSLLPAPKPFTLPNNVSPTYSLAAQSNRARLGEAIPEMFGRNMMMLDLISAPWIDFKDGKQRVMQLFGSSRGRLAIEQIRAGDAVIWENGAVSGAYPEIEVEICDPGVPHTLFDDNVVTSTEVSGQVMLGTNEEGYGELGPFIVCNPGKQAMKLQFDIAMPACFTVSDGGHIDRAEVAFQFSAQQIDNAGEPIGLKNVVVDMSGAGGAKILSLATRSAVRQTYETLIPPGRYKVWGKRTNAHNTDNSAQDALQWFAVRAFLPSKHVYEHETTIAIRATGSANLNGDALQKVNIIATRKLPKSTYHAATKSWTWSAEVPTRSIKDGVAFLLKERGGKTDRQIDLQRLTSLDETWSARGDYFDFVFDSRKSLWQDGIEPMLAAGRTKPMILGDTITFYRDEEISVPATSFSPRNMLAGQFDVDFIHDDGQSPDALLAVFIDNRTWKENQVLCKLPGSTATVDTASKLQVQGITDRAHAWRDVMFMLGDTNYRRRNVTFPTAREGTACLPGSLIAVSHWLTRWGSSADVVWLEKGDTTVIEGVTVYRDLLTLSEPWSRPEGEEGDNLITINTPDGKAYGPVTFSIIDDGDESGQAVIVLTDATQVGGKYLGKQPRDWGVWSGRGLQRERPRSTMGVGNQVPRNCKLITMRPDAGGRSATLNLVVDDPRVYTVDAGAPPAETDGPNSDGAAALIITGATIAERVVVADVNFAADVTMIGAADAASFSMQWKHRRMTPLEVPYGNWTPVTEGLGRTFSIEAISYPGPVKVRVRAKNAAGQYGPWYEFQFYGDGIADTVPLNVSSVARDAPWTTGTVQHFTWPEVWEASRYRVQMVARIGGGEYYVYRDLYVETNEFTYYPANEIDDGGPFIRGYLQVKAVNSAGESAGWAEAPNTFT